MVLVGNGSTGGDLRIACLGVDVDILPTHVGAAEVRDAETVQDTNWGRV